MENSVIAIQSYVITPLIVYALLAPIFFEMDNNALGEGEDFVVNNNDKTTMMSDSQHTIIEEEEEEEEVKTTECKSPCPSRAEMCIEICA
jgi:hypothetical protein